MDEVYTKSSFLKSNMVLGFALLLSNIKEDQAQKQHAFLQQLESNIRWKTKYSEEYRYH